MATGENIWAWSTTAANNGTADVLINFAEGQTRASLNDSDRGMMAALAKVRDLTNGSKISGGSDSAQTVTSGMAFAAVQTGMRILVKNGFTNTASMTLNLDGIGAVTVKDMFGATLTPGAVVLNAYSEYLFDATNWILLQKQPQTGLILLSTQAVAAVATVDFTSGIDATYGAYVFLLQNVS